MARPLRLQLAGTCYLVTARSLHREALFKDGADRTALLDLFGRTCLRYRWRCQAYCLLHDYYQLVITTEIANLAAGMRHLNSVYSQSFNRRHRSAGHLFEGRYESTIVDHEHCLFEAVRHVLRGPLREGLANSLIAWEWSSYQASTGQRGAPSWLAVDEVLGGLDPEHASAVEAFIAELERPTRPGEEHAVANRRYLGDANFMARLLAQAPGRELANPDIPRPQRVVRLPLADFCAPYPDRREAMRAAYRCGCYTQKEIARHFGVHCATVSRAVAAGTEWPLAPGTAAGQGGYAYD